MSEMQIELNSKLSENTNNKIIRAANFYANILMDPRMVRKVFLDIEVGKKFHMMGEAIDEDGVKNPRFFTIKLRNAKGDDNIFQTLAHEMVHIKQMCRNELITGVMVAKGNTVSAACRWKDELWKPTRKEHKYFDAPWEIEAFGREVGMYQRWMAHDKES